jgi:hypothetical protein
MQSLHPSPVRWELIRLATLVTLAVFLVIVALPALLDLAATAAR